MDQQFNEDFDIKRDFHKKLSKDEIVKLTRKSDYSTDDLIKGILKQAAEENARLGLLRENGGLDPEVTINLTKRKAEIIKQMGDLALNLHKTLAANEINLKSEGFKVLLQLLLRKFSESLENSRIQEEHRETVFNEFANSIETLEVEYKKELKAKGLK